MATADLTVIALGRAEASASRYIAEIQRRLAAQDRVRYAMHAMGTSLEGSTADILAVAAQGSFVAAGRLLQRHPTIVSKRLAAMEKRLGVRLVERSTRHVRITEAGLQLEQRFGDSHDGRGIAAGLDLVILRGDPRR